MSQRIAAAAFPLITKFNSAIDRMLEQVRLAKSKNCDLIIFPEAILSGLDSFGDYPSDLEISFPENAPELRRIRDFAKRVSIGIGFGYLENAEGLIYDAYLIYDHTGEPCLHYRRITDTWMPSEGPRDHYACGEGPQVFQTPYGRLGVLLCGDLFDEALIQQMCRQELTLCLHPMARAFPLTDDIQLIWDEQEFPFYLEEYRKLQTDVLVCNMLDITPDDGAIYCGGAWFIRNGQVRSSLPLKQQGLLIIDI
ncbi:MAG TPA: carbon-nitrogen hydrolase family protein [Candidatus Cloacimonadota bacterium]|nr:carbon-nitrogen hydrolase family protein [Candidatus Cloacimonadota bacterium]